MTPACGAAHLGASSVGQFFVLPLRFIGAIALGSSSEVAGASSGWLEKPLHGADTQSRRHRGAGCVRWLAPAALAGSLLSGLGLQHRLERTLAPARGGGGQTGRHCLACECPPLTCKSGSAGAFYPSSRHPARARAGTGQGCLAPLPCLAPPEHPPILSLLFSIDVPKS